MISFSAQLSICVIHATPFSEFLSWVQVQTFAICSSLGNLGLAFSTSRSPELCHPCLLRLSATHCSCGTWDQEETSCDFNLDHRIVSRASCVDFFFSYCNQLDVKSNGKPDLFWIELKRSEVCVIFTVRPMQCIEREVRSLQTYCMLILLQQPQGLCYKLKKVPDVVICAVKFISFPNTSKMALPFCFYW